MKNSDYGLLIILIFFFVNLAKAQDSTSVVDSLKIKKMALPEKSELSGLDDTKFYIFKNHIRTNFGGLGQAIKFDMNHQLFDFMEMGRPQFIAPLNMFPHQSLYNFADVTLNEYPNGMLNTRFLSADQMASMDYSVNPFTVNSLVFNPLSLDEKEAYTRIKYYEGDQGYSDLDIFFSRNFGENTKIQLAGFNKGFSGYYYNSSHTGVAYNTKLDYKINEIFEWDFSWLRNHEISGMGLPTQPENFTYQADAELFGLRFYYKPDTTDLNKITLGLFSGYNYHRNRSKENSYSATQISDDYNLYLSKDFSDTSYKFTTTANLAKHSIHGSVFPQNFSEYVFSVDIFNRFNLNKKAWFNSSVEMQYLQDLDPVFGFSSGFNFLYSNMFTRLKAFYSQRMPNPVERKINYQGYSGNENLNAESLISLAILQKWQISKSLSLQAEGGYNKISDEILFADSTFKNSNSNRSWFYLSGQGQFNFWLFTLSGGGRLISADTYVSPRQTVWSELTFHGNFFNNIFIIDLTGFTLWNSKHDQINYNPLVNRFYSDPGENSSNMNIGFKAVGTVGDAEIFFEMDNLLSQQILYINRFYRDVRRVRFGVNWVLWD